MLPTGMQRWVVVKADAERGVCLGLYLVSHSGSPGLGIAVAPPWTVERVAAWRGAADCVEALRRAPDASARTGSGSVQVRAEGGRCVVDLDVSLGFDGGTPGIAGTETMSARAVAIDGVKPPCP